VNAVIETALNQNHLNFSSTDNNNLHLPHTDADKQKMSSSDTCIYSNNMTLDGTATTPDENLMTHIEVKAIEDPGTGVLVQDKIMISLDLPEEEKCDPLYYYPPSAPAAAKLSDDEDSSDSDSEDEDDEDDDLFDVVDLSPLIIRNPHHRFATKQPEQQQQQQPITATSREEYSFMEELLQTLDNIFGCSYGSCGSTAAEQMPVLKSALRRKLGEAPLTPSMKRNVSFTKLEIREFNMTLGNHPSAVTVRTLCPGGLCVLGVRCACPDWYLTLHLSRFLVFSSFPSQLLYWTGPTSHAGCNTYARIGH